jgi:alpha-galactosidase
MAKSLAAAGLLICTAQGRAGQPGHRQLSESASTPAASVFRLDGGDVTYAVGVTKQGSVQTVYWGARLAPNDPLPAAHPVARSFEINDSPQEFAGWGGGMTAEPSLKITFPDGNRDLVLRYVSHQVQTDAMTIVLKDIERDVFVTLHYEMDAATGILARWAEVENRTKTPFVVEQAESAEWNLPASRDYVLRYLAGRWGGEDQLTTRAVKPGEMALESRRGLTGHEFAPWFAIAKNEQVTEQEGEVWFGSLAWSGSWRITIAQDPMQQVKIVGGYNPFDFGYKLEPGSSLKTPVFYGGVAQHGFEEMSHLESQFQLTKILPQAPHPRPRPVLYNSWEATQFNFDEKTQEGLADKAASIGVERFVMDDGWFSTRLGAKSGLGDWYPNPQRFPNGLKPLIDHVHSLGMDFGLWVEPEMVNENSDLYRKHPDWILHFNGRPRTQGRSQFILNLAMPEVQEYLIGFLDKLLGENDIAFLKWDANRNFSEPGWDQVPPDEQKKIWVAYVDGYYNVLRTIRQRFPKLEIETCSGGGGRVDLGVMRFTDEAWISDNTDPFDRLLIQDGFTYAYTPEVMMAWVTDSPNWYNGRSTSLTYRFLSAMQGSLGIGANLDKWTPEDFANARHLIGVYKEIRGVVQKGMLYRLVSPRDGSNVSATESVSPDRRSAVVFGFLHSQQMGYPFPTIFPRGLDKNAVYSIEAIGGKIMDGTPKQASGAYWMSHGIDFPLKGDFAAEGALLKSERVD